MGTAWKFHVVDFISLQRTIRKICTLCPRKIRFFLFSCCSSFSFLFLYFLYFFILPFWRLCLPLLLLLWNKRLQRVNWNPMPVDFLWNSMSVVVVVPLVLVSWAKGLRITYCQTYCERGTVGRLGIKGLRTNDYMLYRRCVFLLPLLQLPPLVRLHLLLYRRLMATC